MGLYIYMGEREDWEVCIWEKNIGYSMYGRNSELNCV